MAYTKQEEVDLNNLLAKWQKRQLTAVRQNKIDFAFEKMNDIERAVWEQVAKAKSYKDVSICAWELADKIIDRIYKIAR